MFTTSARGNWTTLAHVCARVRAPVRVARVRPEDGSKLEDALKVGADGHLLVELRALRQAGGAAHVVEAEDGGAALAGARDELGRVDLLEPLRQQDLPEQLRARARARGRPGGAVRASPRVFMCGLQQGMAVGINDVRTLRLRQSDPCAWDLASRALARDRLT